MKEFTPQDNEYSLKEYLTFIFIPKGWVCTISNVDFIPFYNKEEYNNFKKDIYPNDIKGYLKSGIQSFFNLLKGNNQ